ncbi:hypothetical protein [Bacillus sp. E(2018)]|nr:hypothetical protein [Bacillus sp. E(2018)]
MSKQKKPLFSDDYLTILAQEINEQFGDTEQEVESKDDDENKGED